MRRYSLILLVALLCAGKLQALSVDDDQLLLVGDSVTQQPQQQEKPTYQAPEKSAKKPAAPVSVFTPTEKISADSAVSFPVDI